MKKVIVLISLLFLLSACAPAAVRPADLPPTFTPILDAGTEAPTFTPWVPEEATMTPILDWATPAPTTQGEKVVTLLPEQTIPTPMRTIPPTPGDIGLTPVEGDLRPVTLDSLDQLAIPTLTYIDTNAGFALDYPAAWQLTSPGDIGKAAVYTASIISFARVTPGPKQQEGIPEGHAKIEIVVIQDKTYTYEEAVDSQRKQSEAEMPTTLLMDEGWLLPSGLPVRRWLVDGAAGQVNILITAIDGRKVIIAGYGEPGLFNVIAGSIRSTK
jgi:hypothetical protein